MAISLNNHESRIKALEDKQVQNKTQITKLWSGSLGTGNITLSQSIDNFDMIVGYGASDSGDDRFFTVLIPKWVSGTTYRYKLLTADGFYWNVKVGSNRTTLTVVQENCIAYGVLGIKFPNTLYNLYYKLYSIREVVRKWLSL